jgi:hypothetical protein
MSDSWVTKTAAEVQLDDRIRARGFEMTVSRVDENFMGRDGMRAFIEDSQTQWLKVPVGSDAEVDVLETS